MMNVNSTGKILNQVVTSDNLKSTKDPYLPFINKLESTPMMKLPKDKYLLLLKKFSENPGYMFEHNNAFINVIANGLKYYKNDAKVTLMIRNTYKTYADDPRITQILDFAKRLYLEINLSDDDAVLVLFPKDPGDVKAVLVGVGTYTDLIDITIDYKKPIGDICIS